jgi:hypothetical protein
VLVVGISLICREVTLRAQEEGPNEELIQAIAEFVKDSDRDIRALAMQQIREEVPGAAATEKFAALLPELSSEAQADLLEALGDRGDAAARDAVVNRLDSAEEAVSAAALRALGSLGGAADVPRLVAKIAAASETVRGAAQQSLVRLRGDDVNSAIVEVMKDANENTRVALLKTLAARNAKDTIPQVLASARDESVQVRIAALSALRFLADADQTDEIVQSVKSAAGDRERRMAKLALLSLCSRAREASTEAIANGLQDADPAAAVVLLRAVARTGGAKALEVVLEHLNSDQEAVHAEALRMLAGWPDTAALDHLLRIAKESEAIRDQVVALRGIARLAGELEERDADLETLAAALEIAKRPEEKRLIVGTLGGVDDAAALELLTPCLTIAELAEEAGLAIILIAQRLPENERAQARAALTRVTERVKTNSIRQRAKKLLED